MYCYLVAAPYSLIALSNALREEEEKGVTNIENIKGGGLLQ